MASGPVPSWAMATSTQATTIWPARHRLEPGVRGDDLLGEGGGVTAPASGGPPGAAGAAAARPRAGTRRRAAPR